jgi:hypothetical protein
MTVLAVTQRTAVNGTPIYTPFFEPPELVSVIGLLHHRRQQQKQKQKQKADLKLESNHHHQILLNQQMDLGKVRMGHSLSTESSSCQVNF